MRSAPSFSIYSTCSDGIREDADVTSKDGEAMERTIVIGDKILRVDSGEFTFVKHLDSIEEGGDDEGEKRDGNLKRVKCRLGLERLSEERQVEGCEEIGDLGVEGEDERGKGFKGIGDLGVKEDEEEKGFKESKNLGVEKQGKQEARSNGAEDLEIRKLGLKQGAEETEQPPSPPMYLAARLGIEGYAFGGDGAEIDVSKFDGSVDREEYYKRMVCEYPLHPFMLKNYAKILESKGDLHGAEDYYHRCMLVEPEDGEILARYANLIWKLHRDEVKASHYFDLAVQAAPQDSNALAARARFLWETDDGDDKEGYINNLERIQAQFWLSQLKADDGREEKDCLMTVANSDDEESHCKCTRMVWDVHHDHEEA